MRIFVSVLILTITSFAIAFDANEYIKQGIKYHDEGKYDEAIQSYESALKIEPNNSTALYEMTYSFMASNKNNECISSANKGLSLGSNLNTKFLVALGNCYSQLKKSDDAINAYERGLKLSPNDPSIHLNIAVTLSDINRDKEAIAHLKEAIKYSNGYSSPYYFIAELYRKNNYIIPEIYFYLQFILLEPNSQRSNDAAHKIYSDINKSAQKKPDGGMNLFWDPNSPKDEGDFSALELALPVTLATSLEKEKSDSAIQQQTNALTDFIQICSEIKDDKISSTFTWQYAAKNLIALQKSEDFNTLAYIVAAKAGIPGAKDWLSQNQPKIEKMSNAIKAL